MKRAVIVALFVLGGCVAPDYFLVRQVAFDQKCPPEQIHVTAWGPDRYSADVTACGKPLSYRNQPVMYENSGADHWTPVSPAVQVK